MQRIEGESIVTNEAVKKITCEIMELDPRGIIAIAFLKNNTTQLLISNIPIESLCFASKMLDLEIARKMRDALEERTETK